MAMRFDLGLVPTVVQDRATGEVLMLGYMNEEAYEKTQQTEQMTFYSRSRQKLWTKGEASGHRLRLREMRVDCDGDTLLALVDLEGPGACHHGYRSCFFRKMTPDGPEILAPRVFDPEKVYKSQASSEGPA